MSKKEVIISKKAPEKVIEGIEDKLPKTEMVDKAVKLVTRKFGLDESYYLSGFKVKPKSIQVSMSNENFSLVIDIKGDEFINIMIELGLNN